MNHEEQRAKNQYALDNPNIGDYWHEMFCPYFIVVDVKGPKITVLSCMGGPNSYNHARKHELNAHIDNRDGTWSFDNTKSMVVDKEWMCKAVLYDLITDFVADVVTSEKTKRIAMEWRQWKQEEMRKEIDRLNKEWEDFVGWTALKEGVVQEG